MKRDPIDEMMRQQARPVPAPRPGEADRLRRALMEEPRSAFRRRWFLLPLAAGFAAAALLVLRPADQVTGRPTEMTAVEPAPAQDDAELAIFVADAFLDFDDAEDDEVLSMADLGETVGLR